MVHVTSGDAVSVSESTIDFSKKGLGAKWEIQLRWLKERTRTVPNRGGDTKDRRICYLICLGFNVNRHSPFTTVDRQPRPH